MLEKIIKKIINIKIIIINGKNILADFVANDMRTFDNF